jgi:mRNA interferase MazF
MTSELSDAPDFRITIDPSKTNGLRAHSQVMADKPVTIRRARVGQIIGRLSAEDVRRLNIALAFVMGLADYAGRVLQLRFFLDYEVDRRCSV